MTLLVEAPTAYEPERRYILDVVLRDWLGLDCELRTVDRDDVRIAVDGGARRAAACCCPTCSSPPAPRTG